MRRLALTAAVFLGLTACSGGSSRPAADPTPVATTDAPTPTPVATTDAPTPTPVATTAVPTPSPTARTRAKPAVDGDVDGDGEKDLVRTTATLLTVNLTSTGKAVTAPIHAETRGNAVLLGVTDVDRDGYGEVFLETAEGASEQFATPYRFDGVALHELQLDGGPVRLGIGGSVMHGDGFTCTPQGLLEIRSADSTDGVAFTVHLDVYRLSIRQLVLVKSSTVKANQGEPAVESSYDVDCGPLSGG